MAYKSLREFINLLENSGELIRIKNYFNPELEITEITDRFSRFGNKALLFENTGKQFPVLINSMGSEKRMCLALGIDNFDMPAIEFRKLFRKLTTKNKSFLQKISLLNTLKQVSGWQPKPIAGRGECQEVITEKPDLTLLPILKCWPHDGGHFITLPVVHTADPHTGTRNVGMYRMQVFGPTLTGMHWHIHKNSARHYREYKALKRKMPVTVTLGGDPVYTYAATAPLPDNFDEYLLAGFLRKKKVELVKCITNDLFVPADVDFVIEGYIDPEEELLLEGPFGDHTGFYSLADYYPAFHVTCITHRKDAVYPATIVGIPPQEDAWIGKATERIFLAPIQITSLPEIIDINMPAEGVFHNIVIVKIKKDYEGHAHKVMNSLWGAGQMMFTKIMIITGDETDIHNSSEVLKAICRNCVIPNNLIFGKGPADILEHSGDKPAFGGKLGFDATNQNNNITTEISINIDNIKEYFKEITAINDHFICQAIPLLIITVNKQNTLSIEKLNKQLCKSKDIKGIKFIVYFDYEIDIHDYSLIVWMAAGNIDPVRDCYIEQNNGTFTLGIDATGKNIKRDWPNPVIMDKITIENIDQKWENSIPHPFIPSPSLKYQKLFKGNSAIAR